MTNAWFLKFSNTLAQIAGHASTFMIAVLLVIVWAISGPLFHFSDTWQLVINTSTTIVTFLMVFLIQNTQNRDTAAMQIKLDELIRAVDQAHNALNDSGGTRRKGPGEVSRALRETRKRRTRRLARRAP